MAAVIQAKTRRSTARCRVTKQVRATEKLLSDDVREIPTEDLKRKLELFKVAVAQDQLLNAMAVEGVSEDDLQKEIEANSVIEDSYEDHTEKMTSAINMGSHFLLYQELKHTEAYCRLLARPRRSLLHRLPLLRGQVGGIVSETYQVSDTTFSSCHFWKATHGRPKPARANSNHS